VAAQQATLDEALRVARLEVETAFNDLVRARKVVDSFETGRLQRAEQLLNMAQTGYSKGADSYLEVLDAQRVYLSEETDYARALASYNIAVATLERAVGGKLR
jgi:outer membrane protein TolC